tara:strand:+ start:132 stop:1079 length:948 start_codon:yes stop_codon:yes gene_type:complete
MNLSLRKPEIVIPGNTPLIELEGILAKLECCNPTGSIKDRMVYHILLQCEAQGIIKLGDTIIEATSGNTGIALSYFGKRFGYNIVLIMPENMSDERKRIIKSLGAELILCDSGDFSQAAQIRDELAQEKGYFNTQQFSNPLNVACHYETTGQEILDNLPGSIDAFVAGVGTGGTLIGTAKRLKEKFQNLYVAAVEPAESAVMNGKKPGPHYIQGIGDGFIPDIASDGNGGLHKLIDEAIEISSSEAQETAQYLSREHNFCVGISSGVNFAAAKRLQQRFKNVITVFPDGFTKYQTLGLYHCDNCPFEDMRKNVLP